MGTIVEDIVVPGFMGVIKQYFNLEAADIVFLGPRVLQRHPTDPSKRREFDCIAWSEDYVFHNETKSSPTIEKIKEFIDVKEIVYEYFPQVKGKILVPIFSSLYLSEEHIAYLSSAGIYAMMLGEENMDIVNFDDVGVPEVTMR